MLQHIIRSAENVIGCSVYRLSMTCYSQERSRAAKILADPSHAVMLCVTLAHTFFCHPLTPKHRLVPYEISTLCILLIVHSLYFHIT